MLIDIRPLGEDKKPAGTTVSFHSTDIAVLLHNTKTNPVSYLVFLKKPYISNNNAFLISAEDYLAIHEAMKSDGAASCVLTKPKEK